MESITTWIELVGTLLVILGGGILLAPVAGIGVTLVAAGVALVLLSGFVSWRIRPKSQAGRDTA